VRWWQWTVGRRCVDTQVLCAFTVKKCDMTRDEWTQSVPKQQQTTTAKQNTHCDAVLYTCHWVLWGVRTRTAACKWLSHTATDLEQGTKRTAFLIDGCRDSDNASRRVEALGVPALQDRGRRGRFIGGNNRKVGGNVRIQSWRRGVYKHGVGAGSLQSSKRLRAANITAIPLAMFFVFLYIFKPIMAEY